MSRNKRNLMVGCCCDDVGEFEIFYITLKQYSVNGAFVGETGMHSRRAPGPHKANGAGVIPIGSHDGVRTGGLAGQSFHPYAAQFNGLVRQPDADDSRPVPLHPIGNFLVISPFIGQLSLIGVRDDGLTIGTASGPGWNSFDSFSRNRISGELQPYGRGTDNHQAGESYLVFVPAPLEARGELLLQVSTSYDNFNDRPVYQEFTLPWNATAAQIQAAVLSVPDVTSCTVLGGPLPYNYISIEYEQPGQFSGGGFGPANHFGNRIQIVNKSNSCAYGPIYARNQDYSVAMVHTVDYAGPHADDISNVIYQTSSQQSVSIEGDETYLLRHVSLFGGKFPSGWSVAYDDALAIKWIAEPPVQHPVSWNTSNAAGLLELRAENGVVTYTMIQGFVTDPTSTDPDPRRVTNFYHGDPATGVITKMGNTGATRPGGRVTQQWVSGPRYRLTERNVDGSFRRYADWNMYLADEMRLRFDDELLGGEILDRFLNPDTKRGETGGDLINTGNLIETQRRGGLFQSDMFYRQRHVSGAYPPDFDFTYNFAILSGGRQRVDDGTCRFFCIPRTGSALPTRYGLIIHTRSSFAEFFSAFANMWGNVGPFPGFLPAPTDPPAAVLSGLPDSGPSWRYYEQGFRIEIFAHSNVSQNHLYNAVHEDYIFGTWGLEVFGESPTAPISAYPLVDESQRKWHRRFGKIRNFLFPSFSSEPFTEVPPSGLWVDGGDIYADRPWSVADSALGGTGGVFSQAFGLEEDCLNSDLHNG